MSCSICLDDLRDKSLYKLLALPDGKEGDGGRRGGDVVCMPCLHMFHRYIGQIDNQIYDSAASYIKTLSMHFFTGNAFVNGCCKSPCCAHSANNKVGGSPRHSSNPALTTSYLNHFCKNILTPCNLSVIAKKNETGSFRASILRLRDAMLDLVSRQSFLMFLLGVAFSLTSLFAVQNILHAYQ
jgi:hypothetical protein